MALPILTWNQGSKILLPERESTLLGDPDPNNIIVAISSAISTSQFWRVDSSDSEYVELVPKNGALSDAEKGMDNGMRIIIQSSSSAPSPGSMKSPDTGLSGGIHVGIAPDGGVFDAIGGWDQSNPFGSKRWSKYWVVADSSVIESLYFVESQEILAMFLVDESNLESESNAGHGRFWGFIAGAMFEPPDDASGESDGRIYGLATNGTADSGITFKMWDGTVTSFLMSRSTSEIIADKYPHVGVFRPDSPTTFDFVTRLTSSMVYVDDIRFESYGETMVYIPVYYRSQGLTPNYYVGKLRQMGAGPLEWNRTIILDGSGEEQAIIFAPNNDRQFNKTRGQSLVFSNGVV